MIKPISLFLIAIFLTACGQAGPLYLPTQKPPIKVPHHKTQKTTPSTPSPNSN